MVSTKSYRIYKKGPISCSFHFWKLSKKKNMGMFFVRNFKRPLFYKHHRQCKIARNWYFWHLIHIWKLQGPYSTAGFNKDSVYAQQGSNYPHFDAFIPCNISKLTMIKGTDDGKKSFHWAISFLYYWTYSILIS